MRSYLSALFILSFVQLYVGAHAVAERDSSVPPADLVSAFRGASWIWTPETVPLNAPPEERAFLKTFALGKTATTAMILITADNYFSALYVNGILVGATPDTSGNWENALLFNVDLQSTSDPIVFGVRVNNVEDPNSLMGLNPAGLLAAIKITFSDGTSTIFTTDASWTAAKTIPAGFQVPSQAANENWDSASVILPYGQGPWGTSVVIPTAVSQPPPSLDPSLVSQVTSTPPSGAFSLPNDLSSAFQKASWIWTQEKDPLNAPPEERAFLKSFTPSGKVASSALILITCDNYLSALYVNGVLVGANTDTNANWENAMVFNVNLVATSLLLAVRADNVPANTTGGYNAAGLLAAVKVIYTDGSSTIFTTDSSWTASKIVPIGFELPSSKESWSPASVIDTYGQGPWASNVILPTVLSAAPPSVAASSSSLSSQMSTSTSSSSSSSSTTAPVVSSSKSSTVTATGSSSTIFTPPSSDATGKLSSVPLIQATVVVVFSGLIGALFSF